MSGYKSEYEAIIDKLIPYIPKKINGRDAILQMRDEGSPNWRQMEWIGFWFEHIVKLALREDLNKSEQSNYGNTRFDLVRKHTWDLKVHPIQTKSLILNDLSAIEHCLKSEGGLGFIILSGNAEYDTDLSFKTWHDQLKGGVSKYEAERIERKAPSRRRKVSFVPTVIEGFWFNSFSEIELCLAKGFMGEFQAGMRNSNGVKRMPKLAIKRIHDLGAFRIGANHFQ